MKMLLPDGSEYQGDVEQGIPNGLGKITFSDGTTIEGMFKSGELETENRVGIVTGLAWTAAGGDILFIEASKMKGKGGLTLTGQLGDVMKESATAPMTYVRSHTDI